MFMYVLRMQFIHRIRRIGVTAAHGMSKIYWHRHIDRHRVICKFMARL